MITCDLSPPVRYCLYSPLLYDQITENEIVIIEININKKVDRNENFGKRNKYAPIATRK